MNDNEDPKHTDVGERTPNPAEEGELAKDGNASPAPEGSGTKEHAERPGSARPDANRL